MNAEKTDALPRSVSYRYDLDGLRGIAIAFVVLFHIFVGRVSGGVDVFLLLSGYFFLGSQLRYASRDDAAPSPWWPIWRTIRRLFPALVLVLGSTALAIRLLTPERQQMDLAWQFLASLGYFQNWELAAQAASYDAASALVSPLQHLWSMAIQGQFYLMAIALAMIIIWARRAGLDLRRVVTPLLVLVTVASFGYAMWSQQVDQQYNYYSTWSRMWQLTLGGLLALHGRKLQLPPWLRAVVTWIGLTMVLTAGLIFDGALQFPGPAALYPIGGAVLIILGGGHSRLSTALAGRSMRWLGDIAYPLYLWHWPLLIISTAYLSQETPSVLLGVGVVAVSLVLADLTHRFVELPLRQHAKRPLAGEDRVAEARIGLRYRMAPRLRAVGAVAVAAVVAVLLTVPSSWQARIDTFGEERLDARLYPGARALLGERVPVVPEYQPDAFMLQELYPPAWANGCMSVFGDDPSVLPVDNGGEDHCVFGDPAGSTEVYLIGGSHAEQWVTPLDMLGREHGFRVVPLVRQSCPAFVVERDGVFSEECQIFNQQVAERLDEVRPDLVISNSTRPLLELARFIDEVPRSYLTLWEFLEDRNIPFVGLRDNPWFLESDGSGFMVSWCVAETGDVHGCGMLREEAYAPVDPSAAYLNARPDMKAVDTADWFCPGETCPGVIGNVYVYRDGNHFSNAFGETLAPLLWREIEEFL
ncbi:acyltransferase family protein [Corynebacterium sp.]|uniref:acyltransferase family protein n=1 Tax=Corynebacterium sp. TaxID=1720 RepID=UPI0026E057A9|nr:acyltransferase family protein [Corynebacterium sp.]MDO5512150.1 acyltransferase family protein [Corynebacterium sp.]